MRTGVRVAAVAALWVGGFVALRFSFLAPEDCPSPSRADMEASAVAAGAWIERGQSDDGRYLYEYDRGADRAGSDYNIVRHAGVTMSLYQLARAGHAEVVDAADVGLAMMLDDVVPAGDGMAFVENDTEARLGASALMAAALAQRRDATGDDRHDDELRALGRFLVGQITGDGQMLNLYDLRGAAPVAGPTSRYATGEAAWALAQLHNLFPGEGWDAPARRVLDYLATSRDEVEDIDYAPWPDQWAAYTLAELAASGLDEHHVAYARQLSQRFGMLVRSESQKDAWPVPFVDPRARGAGLGVWVEGLGALADAAGSDQRLVDVRSALEDRVACGAGLLVERQPGRPAAAGWGTPSLVEGAWFRDDVTRMDDQQHALSGLLVAAGLIGPVGE
ncbi:MAG: hypothetical protein ACRDZZ_10170 [Ilumatobacteraceae bacterium]